MNAGQHPFRFGFFLVSIQFLQLVLGYTPLGASVGLLPQMLLATPLAAIAAPLSMKVGQRRLTTRFRFPRTHPSEPVRLPSDSR